MEINNVQVDDCHYKIYGIDIGETRYYVSDLALCETIYKCYANKEKKKKAFINGKECTIEQIDSFFDFPLDEYINEVSEEYIIKLIKEKYIPFLL